MDVRLPDGTIIRNVPDGTTKEQLTAKLKANGYNLDEPKAASVTQEDDGVVSTVGRAARMLTPAGLLTSLTSKQGRQDAANAIAGGVKGASNIGATILAPVDVAMDAAAGKGLTLESNRQRRQDVTAALEGMGADPKSLPFQAAETGTEVGATLPVGGLVARPIAAVAPRLASAIASGGMSTGARVGRGVAAKAGDLGIRTVGAAINGAASAGLIKPEDAPKGAAIAGATPVVAKALGAAGQAAGAAVSKGLARRNAVNKIAEAVGEADLPQAIADIQTHYPKGAENIPLSSAAITRNPKLAQLEQGSRLNSSPQWWEFDQRQGKAVYDNVLDATREAEQLGERAGARQENWKAAWQAASEAQKPRVWVSRMNGFYDNVNQAMQSAESSNPAVRKVLEEVQAEMDRLGPGFGPGHLQQLRANLNGKVNPMSPDAFKSAPRDNPAIISIKQEMDDILNAATGGKWQKVIEGYAKDSEALHASKAAAKVRGSFVDAQTGRVTGKSLDPMGDVPVITESGLNGAMNAARLPDKSLALSPEANNKLTATLDALRRQSMVQGLKKSATAGGGSDTIPNAIAAGVADKAGAPSLLLQLLGAARKVGVGKTDNEVARLLANPDELASALAAWQLPPTPNRLARTVFQSLPALASGR